MPGGTEDRGQRFISTRMMPTTVRGTVTAAAAVAMGPVRDGCCHARYRMKPPSSSRTSTDVQMVRMMIWELGWERGLSRSPGPEAGPSGGSAEPVTLLSWGVVVIFWKFGTGTQAARAVGHSSGASGGVCCVACHRRRNRTTSPRRAFVRAAVAVQLRVSGLAAGWPVSRAVMVRISS